MYVLNYTDMFRYIKSNVFLCYHFTAVYFDQRTLFKITVNYILI